MNRIGVWWQATRPFAFPASVIPALVGGMVAVVHTGARLQVGAYILSAVGAACAHAAANLLNDYFDFRNGVDSLSTAGASRGMLVTGRMRPSEVLRESLLLWGVAGLIGAYFLVSVGAAIVPLVLAGLVLGVGYTAAPLAFKYRALGDACVFLAFGIGITTGSYVVQTGKLAWTPVFYSLPLALLIWAILHANNLRDISSDRSASIATLALLLGRNRSRMLYGGLLAAAYACIVIFAIAGVIVPAAALPLLSLPLAVGAVRQLRQATAGGAADPAGQPLPSAGSAANLLTLDMRTAQVQLAFGLLLVLGLCGHLLF